MSKWLQVNRASKGLIALYLLEVLCACAFFAGCGGGQNPRAKESPSQAIPTDPVARDGASSIARSESTELLDEPDAKSESQPTSTPGARWALLIGINGYEHMKPLNYACADMEHLYDVLTAKAGYDASHVRLLIDRPKDAKKRAISRTPSRGEIDVALKDFLRQAATQDTILVAFAGHGMQDDEKRNCLCPIDGDDDAFNAYRVDRLREHLRNCRAQTKLVVIDACHSGTDKFIPVNADDAGTVWFFSCKASERSYEDHKLQHGVYSHFFAKAIAGDADKEADGVCDYSEVQEYLAKFVPDYVKKLTKGRGAGQTPAMTANIERKVVVALNNASVPPRVDEEVLKKMVMARQGSKQLLQIASELKDADETFQPAKSITLLLSLVQRGTLNEAEFLSLSKSSVNSLEFHLESRSSFKKRKIRALCIGVSSYPDSKYALQSPVAEAKRFYEVFSRRAGESQGKLLLDEDASKASIEASARELASGLKDEDLIVITFHGHGTRVPVEKNKPIPDGAEKTLPEPSGERQVEQAWLLIPNGAGLAFDEEADAEEILPQGELAVFRPTHLVRLLQKEFRRNKSKPSVLIINDADDMNVNDWMKWSESEFPLTVIGVSGHGWEYKTKENPGWESIFSRLVLNALDGLADGAPPRRFFWDHRKGQFKTTGSEWRDSPSPLGPDGFVSLDDLCDFLPRFQADELGQSSAVVFRGLKRDVTLTRSSLVSD